MDEQELEAPEMVPAPAPKPQKVIEPTAEAHAFVGGVATGKTQALIARVVALIEGGTSAEQILVFCATPDASEAFKRRLQNVLSPDVHVRVTTVRELCLSALNHPSARAFTGRPSRLLHAFEVDFLMDDLLLCGVKPRRLCEMMRFFFKCITEFSDRETDWLLTSEEHDVFNTLLSCLHFMGGFLEPELANRVCTWLERDQEAKLVMSVEHVLADDYQLYARASQALVNLLARDSVALGCDPDACVEAFDSFPYADGLDEFLQANPHADVKHLDVSHACVAATTAARGLRSDQAFALSPLGCAPDAPIGRMEVWEASQPSDEMVELAHRISELIARGMHPADVFIACPDPLWQRNAYRALVGASIPAEQARSARLITGDIHHREDAKALRVLTALYLVANPQCGVAWRSWCGFGDNRSQGEALLKVRSLAQREDLSLVDALAYACEHQDVFEDLQGTASVRSVCAAYDAGRTLIDRAQNLEGEALLKVLAESVLGQGAEVPCAVQEATAPFVNAATQGFDATALASRAYKRLTAPVFERDDCVRVAPYERIFGTTPQALILCGFVNGLIPKKGYFDYTILSFEQAQESYAHDERLLVLLVGKSQQLLAVSAFSEVPADVASRLGVKVKRIQVKGEQRIAQVEPSVFLKIMCDQGVEDETDNA